MNKEFFDNIPIGSHLFGRFTLLSVISSCDSSAVYKCVSTWGETRGRFVALKVTVSDAQAASMQEQLIKEIKILSKIVHPNIIQAFDWFQDDSFLAYSMEYVEGGTLDTILENSSGRSVQWSLNLLSQLAGALHEIHRAGIIHRDIKPQNILVTANNELKVADFGIAVRLHSKRKDNTEQITGTIDFVSPEYIKNGIFDQRSDIYAWGVIAYLMLTGHVPFEDESIVDALAKKVTQDPPSPQNYRSHISNELSALILKALARNPKDRFQTCDELIEALGHFGVKPRKTGSLSAEQRSVIMQEVA